MGVTIDSINLEIQSDSTKASQGVDNFVKSLQNLKKAGNVTTVAKNLNSLSTAIRGFAGVAGATTALGALANSIAKLRSAGSIASQVNNLTKLRAALTSLESVNAEGFATKIKGIADAMAPLSSVKASGFNSLVKSLGSISAVTKSLDDKTIADFAAKVELLNKKLGPFAEKMATVKTAFSAINTQARAASSGVKEFDHGINTSTLNMSSFIEVVRTAIDHLMRMIQGFADLIAESIEWDGIAARFGRGFGPQAKETYEWIQRLNEEMGINVQQFMKYSSVYATMLTGFGVAQEDATKMALGYTELTYDIWAGYNDIYKTFDEASEAVKSAIAGEVEPIRRAGFTIVESQLEQTAAAHGLEISLYNATEAQKSYLRYLTLVDQAHSQSLIGTYAKELNTAEGLTRTLAQQMKSLSQAFGSLFLPILVRVLPYVQAFVELLTEAVYWLANLFGIEIQPVDWSGMEGGAGSLDGVKDSADGATGALNDATKAAKELKNATIGIDELNVISPSSAAGSNGAGGAGGAGANGFPGLDIDSLWDESIFDSIQQNVDEIKSKLKDWLPVIGGIATALAGLKLTNLLKDIDNANIKFSGLGKALTVAGITLAVGKLVWDFTGAYLEGGDEKDLLKALGTTTIGVALARWLGGKPGAAFVLAVSGIVTLSRLAVEIKNGEVEWNDTEALITGLVGGLETIIGGVLTWKTIAPIVKKLWPKIAAKAGPLLAKAGPYGWIAIAVAGGVTLALVDYDFTDVGRTLGEKLSGAFKAAGAWFKKNFDIDDLWDGLYYVLHPVEFGKKLEPLITGAFDKIIGWFREKIDNLKGNIKEFFSGLFDGLGWDNIFTDWLLGGDYRVSQLGIPLGEQIADGIVEGFKSIEFFAKTKEKFNNFVQSVKDFFGIKSPSTLMRDQIGKQLIPGITSGMSLNGIKDRLASIWSTAKTWWDSKKSVLKTYTPSIGSIYEKLKERWDNARTWWNDKKTKAKEYTPSIGSIYDKLYTRWKNARDWWNNKKGSMSYTPSIGSITDKLKSAWNSAKSWWSKNVKLSIPSLSFKVSYSNSGLNTAQKAIVKALGLSGWPKLSFAANGGMFDQGSLVWAGERGPEVVANAGGGKTGVMNVQQMYDAMYEAVYAATIAANRTSGSQNGGVTKLYLDGREITSVVEKRQNERGASIMGNAVYAY